MNNTALGAENKKEQTINFISEAHEKFYYKKLKEVRYQDVYHKALCYCLEEADIVRENCIDMDFLNYTPELRDNPTVQDALKKLIAAYPDKEVNERETKEMKIQTLAAALDQLSYAIDTFEYRDSVPDREAQVQMIANDIRSGNVKPLQIFCRHLLMRELTRTAKDRQKS